MLIYHTSCLKFDKKKKISEICLSFVSHMRQTPIDRVCKENLQADCLPQSDTLKRTHRIMLL